MQRWGMELPGPTKIPYTKEEDNTVSESNALAKAGHKSPNGESKIRNTLLSKACNTPNSIQEK
ncbi:MAG: hypothetical protein ACTS73_09850 [Arsenophonus sp. NEOnobi-MAG3]